MCLLLSVVFLPAKKCLKTQFFSHSGVFLVIGYPCSQSVDKCKPCLTKSKVLPHGVRDTLSMGMAIVSQILKFLSYGPNHHAQAGRWSMRKHHCIQELHHHQLLHYMPGYMAHLS